MRQANRKGPLGKVAPYAAGALALAAAVALYLNFDTVRQIRLDFSEITDLFADNPGRSGPGEPAPSPDELPTEVVEGGGVAGDALPTSIDGETPAEPAPAPAPTAESPSPRHGAATASHRARGRSARYRRRGTAPAAACPRSRSARSRRRCSTSA